MGILRLSHVEVRCPDLELSTAYYTEVMGLIETAVEDEAVYLKGWDEQQHHSLILRYAPTYGVERVGFKVQHAEDLDELTSAIEGYGIATKRFAAGELGPGSGETVRFVAPSGHTIELVHGMEQIGNALPLHNPPPEPQGLSGMHPPRIDHVFLMCEDVDEITRFYTEVLGFRLTEQIVADDGHQLATFLERTHTAHDIAFIVGPDAAFHHVAYWVDDWNDLRRSADIAAYHGVRIDAGPTRHGATRGWGLYFFDPAGNRNEVYTGGYWADPDREPITWTEAQMGRAVFYYEGVVDQNFLTVHS
ncbi:catechol 2,3-dioxygenase [Nocardioides agariphilus]|uniref:Metapyrocatechase n=1 Tax=Nocardioides agariphilus TaxID=433664 RepID=A0A930VLF8_9ACTN|nr:catechol 2,3-dioxygenase [Nocardioides agariphilus]MBF4767776.1 catechol 2,3-dioxygenase [Nocardioides agariphilus]